MLVTCHQPPHHFFINEPWGNSNLLSILPLPTLQGSSESFGQVRHNYPGLLVLIRRFEGQHKHSLGGSARKIV
jgi:hypothetical protein